MFFENDRPKNAGARQSARTNRSSHNDAGYWQRKREESLIKHIENVGFPCVGAKSALAGGGLNVFAARLITSAREDRYIHDALLRLNGSGEAGGHGFRSLAVIFSGPQNFDEASYEIAMWRRLGALLTEDRRQGHDQAAGFSDDPADPKFALSFGGRAFFAVGLHPNASRKSRRLPFPAIIFNPHDQFKRLRADQKYERMREVILARDATFDGKPNPMVARHGEISEARQYSGRAVPNDWTCPLARRGAY